MTKKQKIYETIISFFAIVSVVFAVVDIKSGLNSYMFLIDRIIYFIFLIDYLARFFISKNKMVFFKNNVFDLIAIIPVNSAFRIFRVAKLTKLFRLSKLAKISKLSKLFVYTFRLTGKVKRFLNTNGFKYVLIVTLIFIFLGGISIHYVENMSLSDGLWWAFVTTTTVGYGDLSPSSSLGRFIAVILMLIGIGLIGSLTSTITSFFMNANRRSSVTNDMLSYIKSRLDDVSSLTDDDIDYICSILKTLNK